MYALIILPVCIVVYVATLSYCNQRPGHASASLNFKQPKEPARMAAKQ